MTIVVVLSAVADIVGLASPVTEVLTAVLAPVTDGEGGVVVRASKLGLTGVTFILSVASDGIERGAGADGVVDDGIGIVEGEGVITPHALRVVVAGVTDADLVGADGVAV